MILSLEEFNCPLHLIVLWKETPPHASPCHPVPLLTSCIISVIIFVTAWSNVWAGQWIWVSFGLQRFTFTPFWSPRERYLSLPIVLIAVRIFIICVSASRLYSSSFPLLSVWWQLSLQTSILLACWSFAACSSHAFLRCPDSIPLNTRYNGQAVLSIWYLPLSASEILFSVMGFKIELRFCSSIPRLKGSYYVWN